MKQLPEDHIAALSVLSFAMNEVNVIQKFYISISHEYQGIEVVDGALNIHKFFLLRTWSSKLFEVQNFLTLGGKKKKTEDRKLLRLANQALDEFKPLRTGDSFELVRFLRNEVSNHFSFKSAKDNLAYVRATADFNFYTHEVGGNDLYPMGEEVLFQARLSRKWANFASQGKKNKLLLEWLNWNLKANKWLQETHFSFHKSLLFKPLNNIKFKNVNYKLPNKFVGDIGRNKLPIFYEIDK